MESPLAEVSLLTGAESLVEAEQSLVGWKIGTRGRVDIIGLDSKEIGKCAEILKGKIC